MVQLVESSPSVLQPMSCPICRRRVTLLLPREGTDVSAFPQLQMYNRRFGQGRRSLAEGLQDIPTLIRQFAADLSHGRSTSVLIQARVLLTGVTAVVYTLLPVDLLPEAFLGAFG